MEFTVIIPARYASSRLPGKPLLDIAGKTMLQRVYEQAGQSKASRIVIATDDERIVQAAKSFNAEVVMTSDQHPSGTDRLEEVVSILGLSKSDQDIVINVQGDEPLIPPELIDQVAKNLTQHSNAGIATLCEQIDDVEQVFNPNVVKVVFDHRGFANYFSRAPIPYARQTFKKFSGDHDILNSTLPEGAHYYRHIGIYAYRVGFLKDYVTWPPSMVEKVECLEQLRALSNGVAIHVDIASSTMPAGVDTQEDLERLRALLS